MNTFSFLDGTLLPTGTLVPVPQQAIMRYTANYTDTDHFSPLRFRPDFAPNQAVQK
ncbi:hypothetical protein F4810DRAFT_650515 [Camillea tinctor]|nr:hypothetical protein F4810DRAFT_650515 [Camillea tinctor]